MKTWGKCCILYILFITFIIFIVSNIILFLKVNTNGINFNSGLMFIHENGLWFTMKILYTPEAHKNINEMFNPTFLYQGQNGSLYFSTGINLLLVAFPFFILISLLVIKKMIKLMYYPIPENLIDEKNHIKKELKKLKKDYKLNIKSNISKPEIVNLSSNFATEMIYLKNEKLNLKNEIKMDYKLRKKHKHVKIHSENNEI